MKKFGLLFILFSTLSFAQISLTGAGSYTQDFNSLANTGTSSTLPAGWVFYESGTNANTNYTAGNGSSNTGDTYSFGATSSTERAFGGLQSGTLVPTIGASFINNTGFTITQIPIAYTGEQWRLGTSGRNDRLDFQYSLDATSLANGTWVDVDNLDFIAPIGSGTVGSLDGNLPANRVAKSYTVAGLNIINGATLWIRWNDFNATGADDGLAIDDFSIDQTNLPVELSSFSAAVVGNAVKLNWKTETEVNNYGFEVERNTPLNPLSRGEAEGRGVWEKIGFVNGNGNSNSPKSYSFTDSDVLSGKCYYRLKQIDNDGQFEYSKTIDVDLGVPTKFELAQNFPNPFNPTTKIRYAIPTPPSSSPLSKGRNEVGFVTLKVYDVLGNEVATLVNEEEQAGIYEVEFNPTGLASGIYFYRLQTGAFIQSRKMTLVK